MQLTSLVSVVTTEWIREPSFYKRCVTGGHNWSFFWRLRSSREHEVSSTVSVFRPFLRSTNTSPTVQAVRPFSRRLVLHCTCARTHDGTRGRDHTIRSTLVTRSYTIQYMFLFLLCSYIYPWTPIVFAGASRSRRRLRRLSSRHGHGKGRDSACIV